MESWVITKKESTALRMQWFEHTGRTKRYACKGLATHVTVAYVECGVNLLTQHFPYNGVVTHVCSNRCTCHGWVFPLCSLMFKVFVGSNLLKVCHVFNVSLCSTFCWFSRFHGFRFPKWPCFPLCGVDKCVDKCKSGSPAESRANESNRVNWGHPFAFVNDTNLENPEA